ncbi:hypothetical protein CYMTET_31466 [Cymbomonas tetramitiformis]|uniref:SAM domain-containing protein n=1 Tax=Cymbomonas tetramitiformis TaxID=36881 RepID=A0AAE0FGR3_9CHLO|nr:hypothetical protein CYMTET_31466 [Cymbomonas tetramitiformis]
MPVGGRTRYDEVDSDTEEGANDSFPVEYIEDVVSEEDYENSDDQASPLASSTRISLARPSEKGRRRQESVSFAQSEGSGISDDEFASGLSWAISEGRGLEAEGPGVKDDTRIHTSRKDSAQPSSQDAALRSDLDDEPRSPLGGARRSRLHDEPRGKSSVSARSSEALSDEDTRGRGSGSQENLNGNNSYSTRVDPQYSAASSAFESDEDVDDLEEQYDKFYEEYEDEEAETTNRRDCRDNRPRTLAGNHGGRGYSGQSSQRPTGAHWAEEAQHVQHPDPLSSIQPEAWSLGEVLQWLSQQGLSHLADQFAMCCVDGSLLMALTEADLQVRLLPCPSSPTTSSTQKG